jgi:glutathione S-transferase
MFVAEAGLALAEAEVDIGAGENRRAPYLALNPAGETPALRCPDGSVLGEATVICEHLEEISGASGLLGSSPLARAQIRMWVRRIDLKVVQPFTGGFRYGPALSFFKPRVHCIPQASEELFAIAREGLEWIDAQIGDCPFIAGPALSLADIVLYCFLDFNRAQVKRPLIDGLPRLPGWFERIDALPSAAATRR